MLIITNIETAGNDEALSRKFNVRRGILNWCELYTQNTQLQ